MSIFAVFRLIEKRKIIRGDKAPVYVLEAVEDGDKEGTSKFSNGPPLGRLKLKVSNKQAQQMLRDNDEFYVEINPRRPQRTPTK